MVEGTFADNHNDTLKGGLLGGVDAGPIARDIFNVIYPVPGKQDNVTPTASSQTNSANETTSADNTNTNTTAAPVPATANAPASPDAATSTSATTGAPAGQ
jgi:hypothetical protein